MNQKVCDVSSQNGRMNLQYHWNNAQWWLLCLPKLHPLVFLLANRRHHVCVMLILVRSIYTMVKMLKVLENMQNWSETAQVAFHDRRGFRSVTMIAAPTCSCGSMWSKSRQARDRLILSARHKAIRPPTFTSFWRRSSCWICRLSARNSASATAPSTKKTCKF